MRLSSRFRSERQVNLAGIAGNDHARIFTHAGQEHFHLHRRCILRLIQNDKGIGRMRHA